MRLHRFYVSERLGQKKEFDIKSAELVNQVKRVFRLKQGNEVILFDGSGSDFLCSISGFARTEIISLIIKEGSKSRYMPKRKIALYAGVIKKDLFELIAEKATELGVTDIVPVITERTEKKSLNEARLKKIVIEASEQSGRGDVPTVHDLTNLDDAVKNVCRDESVIPLVFHTDGKPFGPKLIRNDSPLAVFIGPEGGWSPKELDMFYNNNISVCTLGSQVLRAETAVVAALSQTAFTG